MTVLNTMCITIICMFHWFLILLQGLGTFSVIFGSDGTILKVLFLLFTITCSGHLSEILYELFASQNSIEFYVLHFLGWILGFGCTICPLGQIKTSCTIPSGSPSPSSVVWSYSPFVHIHLCDWLLCLSHYIIYIYYFAVSCQFLLWHSL